MTWQKFLGVEGKSKITIACVVLVLIINAAFVIYSAMYTIPAATLERDCKQLMVNDCAFTTDVYLFCMMNNDQFGGHINT